MWRKFDFLFISVSILYLTLCIGLDSDAEYTVYTFYNTQVSAHPKNFLWEGGGTSNRQIIAADSFWHTDFRVFSTWSTVSIYLVQTLHLPEKHPVRGWQQPWTGRSLLLEILQKGTDQNHCAASRWKMLLSSLPLDLFVDFHWTPKFLNLSFTLQFPFHCLLYRTKYVFLYFQMPPGLNVLALWKLPFVNIILIE